MNRRGFLQFLGAGAAAAIAKPKISAFFDLVGPTPELVAQIPPLAATDAFLTLSIITQEALRMLESELLFAKAVRRHDLKGVRIGQSLNIRFPAKRASS